MSARQPLTRPGIRTRRPLREALLDARALLPPGTAAPATRMDEAARRATKGEAMNTETRGKWNAGLRLDGVANIAVLCTGVAIVVATAAADGLFLPLHAVLQA